MTTSKSDLKIKALSFTSMLDAWAFVRKNGLKAKPKRISLYKWEVKVKA